MIPFDLIRSNIVPSESSFLHNSSNRSDSSKTESDQAQAQSPDTLIQVQDQMLTPQPENQSPTPNQTDVEPTEPIRVNTHIRFPSETPSPTPSSSPIASPQNPHIQPNQHVVPNSPPPSAIPRNYTTLVILDRLNSYISRQFPKLTGNELIRE